MAKDVGVRGGPASDQQGLGCGGTLHIYVAFDWGEQIQLEEASLQIGASRQELPRRRRTPSSFSYRPSPLHLTLDPVALELAEIGPLQATAGVTLFDFGAVSLALRVPIALSAEALLRLAGSLADPSELVQRARGVLEPLYQQLLPAIGDPSWQSDLSEDYFVFQLVPSDLDLVKDGAGWVGRRGESPESAIPPCAAWLAGLVHLESAPLSSSEIGEALRLQLSYSPGDVFIADWGAAVLIDQDCDETLQAVEFANLQLLEFRHIDNRLDASLAAAARTIEPWTHSWLPFWRIHGRPLRALGELKVEANALFERTENALKLVGDPYLARVYRLVAARFHLETWEENIRRKLEVAEGVYQVVSDQASHFRTEFLEVIVVLLILIEIVLAFVR
jgi:hypothetical protein